MQKRGGIDLSVHSIVLIVIVLVVASLFIFFITKSLEKSTVALTEQIATEQDPPNPTKENPITLSRSKIQSSSGATEVIKVAVLNPTSDDWTSRDTLYGGFFGCNAVDRICYVSGFCDGTLDQDCQGNPERECTDDGICFIDEDNCPEPDDDDCHPGDDGVDLLLRCDNDLTINKISEPKIILSQETVTYTIIIEIKKGIKGTYLCEIKLFGDEVGDIQKDFTVGVS
ncbi:MAG: hypothetical protein ABIC04_06485 [Nanoarchaeota archaeon]